MAQVPTTKVRVETTVYPPAHAEWYVELADDPQQALVYNNLAYDTVALMIARLGVLYSAWLLDEDKDKLDKAIAEIHKVLTPGVV